MTLYFQLIRVEIKRDIAKDSAIEMVKEVKNSDSKDCLHTQEVSIKFCKQQELKKATNKIQTILDSGDFDRYDECEDISQRSISSWW